MNEGETLATAAKKAAKALYNSLPLILGIVLLIGLVNTFVSKELYLSLFSKNIILSPIIGSALGSIFAGNPITSYILGGEFLNQGVSLIVVTAFLVAWVTVGLVQLPAESILLGKKFAILRNIFSFVFSIIVAITTVFLLRLI